MNATLDELSTTDTSARAPVSFHASYLRLATSVLRVSLVLLLTFVLGGCTGTVGPYVADIREMPDGRLEVIRCTTTVTYAGQIVSYDNGECTKKIVGRSTAPAPDPTLSHLVDN
jgi:hypothetical protein